MTKGTKIFRVAVCVLLGLIILWGAFMTLVGVFFAKTYIHREDYGIWVTGVSVTRDNEDDILGDGTVSYNASTNTLTFQNALIESDHAIVGSEIDLRIKLVGENKFICKDAEYMPAIYAADSYLNKDLSFEGDGSLTIEFRNVGDSMQGILAANVTVGSDLTLIMGDCATISNGIVCDSSLILADNATVTVQGGAATHSAAVRVRGNAYLEEGTALNISVKSGSVESCKGLSINGDLTLGKNTDLTVTSDDETAAVSECVRVTGFMDVEVGAKVTASAKKTPAIECYGSMELNRNAVVTAITAAEGADVLCYGAVVNLGATVEAEVDAFGGIH